MTAATVEWSVRIPARDARLDGDLAIPDAARGIVVFAHGSGSSRMSPRNRAVAEALRAKGLGTLLMDLLTADEEYEDLRTSALRFDVPLLAERLIAAIDWLEGEGGGRAVVCFGASTGAAAALVAAARRPEPVRAVVSRGGRPDLAGADLDRVRTPTLLIVGGLDDAVMGLNEDAHRALQRNTEARLSVVPGARHLFEEPGALEEVARLAADWYVSHLSVS